MIYELIFKCHGKLFSFSQSALRKAHDNQYEAIALGLLLDVIEREHLSREDKYIDLEMLEYEETPGSVKSVVWSSKEYIPVSTELK